jgi:MraZ protein
MERREVTRIVESPTVYTFFGTYEHSLDSKKRLTIPSEWRDQIDEAGLFVLPGVNEKCLAVLPAQEMMIRLEKLRQVSMADARAQQFVRAIFSRASQLTLDSHGRVRVPDTLLGFAGVDSSVTLAGVGHRFELWSPEQWLAAQPPVEEASLAEAARYIGF